jgi:AcrR family transcriptional regulator
MRITKDPKERRAELIAAARELFERQGIPKTSISQIVNRVGVAQGLFYYYFKSKDQMVNAVIDSYIDELISQMTPIIEDMRRPVDEKIAECVLILYQVVTGGHTGGETLLDQLDKDIMERIYTRAVNQILPMACRINEQAQENGRSVMPYSSEEIKVFLYGVSCLLFMEGYTLEHFTHFVLGAIAHLTQRG